MTTAKRICFPFPCLKKIITARYPVEAVVMSSQELWSEKKPIGRLIDGGHLQTAPTVEILFMILKDLFEDRRSISGSPSWVDWSYGDKKTIIAGCTTELVCPIFPIG